MAVATPTCPRTAPTERPDTKLRHQPPYAVVVLNDHDHTFDYVIAGFQKVFGYNLEKCITLAKAIHNDGRTVVWTGSLEVAELKKEQIESLGPDQWAPKVVNYPLGVELEPLPV